MSELTSISTALWMGTQTRMPASSIFMMVVFWFGHGLIGMALMMAAVILPITKRQKSPKGTEDWPSTPAGAAPSSENPQTSNLE